MLRTDAEVACDADGWGGGTVPETLLPVQMFSSARATWQPEKRLMLAVLENALLPFLRNSPRRHGRLAERRPLTAEVKSWIASDAWHWPFAFVNICHVLGLDEQALRSALLGRGTGARHGGTEPAPNGADGPPALALGRRSPRGARASIAGDPQRCGVGRPQR